MMSGHDMHHCATMSKTGCGMDMGSCDMSLCKTMTKDECAAHCDSVGCSDEQKAACLSMYGADGKFDEAKCKEMCSSKGNPCMEGCTKGCKTAEECAGSCGDACVKSHETSPKGACCKEEKSNGECKH
jgi:K(+)-stimulated pyrophosphate-energized sodium pump